jgi:lipooligosaccharide transport system ATP-binding protein
MLYDNILEAKLSFLNRRVRVIPSLGFSALRQRGNMQDIAISQEIINARNLVKRYNGKAVVNSINFQVYRGECFGILGPNGAGKTTTVRMIYGLSRISDGELTVMGLIVGRHSREIRKHLGVVSQDNNLDPDLTVWENMKMFARYYGLQPGQIKGHLMHLLDLMDLTGSANARVETLSGGMKRRLAIARSLINNPKLLILDEPTTGLDPQARHLVWQQLRKIKEQQITILLTTHYLEEATKLCDRLVIMDQGQILEEGKPLALVEKHVGPQVLELGLKSDPPVWQEMIMTRFPQLLKGSWLLGDTLHLYTGNGSRLLQELQEIDPPSHYHLLRAATLEDVFLKLTGKEFIPYHED